MQSPNNNKILLLQQQAASTTVYCATATELTGISGQYYNNCYFCTPSKASQNEEMASSLFDISEKLIKQILQYNFFSSPPNYLY